MTEEKMFHVSQKTLEDGSAVHDVTLSEMAGYTVFAAPSERTADYTANTMNKVLERLAECGSDREVADVSAKILKALEK